MKKMLLFLILFVSVSAFSQSINDYKYVIVPIKYDFLKENDRYGLNTSTKLLLQKYGFIAYLSNEEIPMEVNNNRCSYLTASLEEDNGMFSTKVKVVLKDCKDKVVYETEYGSSRDKQLSPAYNEALRMAAKSFDKLKYKYNDGNGAMNKAPTSVTTIPVKNIETPKSSSTENSGIFYTAKPVANGFQVVDKDQNVVMSLYNSSQKNMYLAQKGAINGVVILKENQWYFEYSENGNLVSEAINLKF
jgi:hypothetical protein